MAMRLVARMTRPWRRLARDTGGTSLIEFAISLPFLALLYLGSYQLSDALACYRKVTVTTRAVADLTTQFSSLKAADADAIMAASTQIMAPYNAANASVRVSEIYTDILGITHVVWSRAQNGTALTTGAIVVPPTGIVVPNTYLVYAEVNYTYNPIAQFGLKGATALKENVYMSPRVSPSVTLS